MSPDSPYNMKTPFLAPVLGLRPLTKEGSAKESFHIDFSLEGSGLSYVTGDALGVIPCNDEKLVDALIAALGLDATATIATPDGSESALRDALINSYDITNLKKANMTKWNAVAQSDELAAILADKDALKDFIWGRDFLDLASNPEMKANFPDAASFVAILGKMAPRLYSIASSPDAVAGQVSLCVGAVRFTTDGRDRGGVCSTYMADRVAAGDLSRTFVHSNKNFRLPTDGTVPVIMVGPGTGIAPFRAFWQQRVADKATGPMWLFFGNPYAATDGCYEDEIQDLVDQGRLKYSVAWSRDQDYKIYVQNLMDEQAEELWQWLEKGAAFYVCGDAHRMAKDVETALLNLIAKYGERTPAEAKAYLADMKANKRYQRDVY